MMMSVMVVEVKETGESGSSLVGVFIGLDIGPFFE
jgi:hypothetical protein